MSENNQKLLKERQKALDVERLNRINLKMYKNIEAIKDGLRELKGVQGIRRKSITNPLTGRTVLDDKAKEARKAGEKGGRGCERWRKQSFQCISERKEDGGCRESLFLSSREETLMMMRRRRLCFLRI